MSSGWDSLSHIPRRRYLYIGCISLIGISVVGLLSSTLWTLRPSIYQLGDGQGHSWFQGPQELEVDQFDFKKHLKGSPTNNFRDNLLPNVRYITSWISAGWTNDVMTYMNLIYLGILTNRVAILPTFVPSHIGREIPPINVGEVFDLPRLAKAIGRPVLEWHQVKNISNGDFDELGCWSVWQAVQDHETFPRRSPVPDMLKLDISYTKAPSWIKLIPSYEHDQFSTFSSLVALSFPEVKAENAGEPTESPQHRLKLPPDDHVLCYDYLYYVCSNQPYEFDFDYSPAWLFVGQHMHWSPKLEKLADEYLRKAFGLEDRESTPPWIAVHVRHGDFADWCGEVPVESCFASLNVIARRVEEVKQEILVRKGIIVEHVVMTSDERNATWWEDVKALGWFGLDHSETVQTHGAWYPVFIDAVVQSSGLGFVGNDRSTMSTLARRRVQAWGDGAVRTTKWGRPGSDDH